MLITRNRKLAFALALGGGGARGLAHVGVLKVLEAEGIRIKGIAGVSMGAIIGAMYAYYGSALEVEDVLRKFLAGKFHKEVSKILTLLSEDPEVLRKPKKIVEKLGRSYAYLKAASGTAVISRRILRRSLGSLLPDVQFRNLRIPFVSISSDLLSGREIIFRTGGVRSAIIASSLVPGIVEPLKVGHFLLSDGTTTGIVPVNAALSSFGGKIIAVDVSRKLERSLSLRTGIEIALRAGEITASRLNNVVLEKADFILRPMVGDANWLNFDRFEELLRAGENAARKSLNLLNGSK